VKRHPALVALSHDHHHALVHARRLREGDPAGFAEFFARDLVRHFRQEEEVVFPLLAEVGEHPPELARALVEHARVRALARRPGPELGELLEAHVRLEERVLFETIQRAVPDERLTELLPSGRGGPEWGTATDDLNATILQWPPGAGPPEHVNEQADVVLVVLDGQAVLALDGEARHVAAGDVVVLERGRRRHLTAGPGGVRYLTVHRRRGGLEIATMPRPR
jgi:mannose-6-phosphate isomerase-like protein (cupin superfamily)